MVDYDVIVIGSGFGGSVTALRLTEKGYRVGVLEAGRRFTSNSLPKTSWDLRDFFWLPKLGMLGIQRLTFLKDVFILSGTGVGGGSLVYANTLYEPLDPFYADPQWRHIADWRAELAPFYDQARRMLGVVETPITTPADDVMRQVADEMGVADTFHPTPVAVYFGDKEVTVPDPYFGGDGPERTGCNLCGGCMVGCRFGAKNSLDANYLHLAERGGAAIHPEHMVTDVRPLPEGGYEVTARHPSAWRKGRNRRLQADQVVFSANALGTQQLLHRLRDEGRLPRLSPRLGHLTRTNSEALLAAQAPRFESDLSQGIAIGSSFHPDENTHVEPVRYPKGSNSMGLLASIMTEGGGRTPRWVRFVGQAARHPVDFLRSLWVGRWSERTIIVLVMQSLDNSIRVYRKRGLFGAHLSSEQGHGEPNPTWIPVGQEIARRVARRIGGQATSTWSESLFDIPITAHIIGGCAIGDSPATGVIDPYQRVYGHPGLHVADSSAISANLGVNPALTITAMTERAMAMWPNKGTADPRPALGEPYRPVQPVPPARPAVPAAAAAALWYASE